MKHQNFKRGRKHTTSWANRQIGYCFAANSSKKLTQATHTVESQTSKH